MDGDGDGVVEVVVMVWCCGGGGDGVVEVVVMVMVLWR